MNNEKIKEESDLSFKKIKNAYNNGGQTASPLPFKVFQLFLPVATTCSASRVLSSCEGV
jgi:hypothetical protein